MKFKKVLVPKKYIKYLEKRELLKQFEKNVNFLKNGNLKSADFKLREAKNNEIYYFRINKQFRAFWVIQEFFNQETQEIEYIFTVSEISNHQEK